AVFLDQTLQFAARDEIAAYVVEPNRLCKFKEIFQRIDSFRGSQYARRLHAVSPYLFRAKTSLAVAITCSLVNPNFFIASFPGPDAPKVVIPMIAPDGPT